MSLYLRSQITSTVNRVDRLHAILVHLQSKKRVTAQELADRFGLSLRTVYRDIKALDESGVPVIGEAGIGYSVMEGYRLPPVMFTQDEAAALILISKFAEKFADQQDKRNFESALFKIKAVLRSTDKEFVEELDSRVAVQTGPVPVDDSMELHLSAMRKAIVEKRVITIQYYSAYKEETTERQAEPIGLLHYSQAWHFIGWCRLRQDYRDFRMDRIRRLQIMDTRFDDSAHPSLQEYMGQLKRERELTEVVISFDKEMARYMFSQKYYYGYVSEEERDGRIFMRFLSAHIDSLARWLLMYTNAARIEHPESLQQHVQTLLQELNLHYK